MAQVNTCLKRVFTIFNVFFAIVGGVIIALALLSQTFTNAHGGQDMEGRTTGLIALYVFGFITVTIAILGAYGAHKESKVCLIIFLVCMVVGSLLMLRVGIPIAAIRPQLSGIMEEKFRAFLPLDQAAPRVKEMAEMLQTELHCCGLFSYHDWGNEIPNSCECSPMEREEEGKCHMLGYRGFMVEKKTIYNQTCFPILMHYLLMLSDIVIGVFLSLAVLALLGMILSSIIIHQLRRKNNPALLMTVTVPTIFTTPPPKYQELHNPPGY